MSNKRKRSVQQKGSLASFFKGQAFLIVVIVLVIAYVVISCFSALNVSLQTQTALPSTVYKTVSTQALVVRNETRLENKKDQVVIPSISDGEKVAKDGQVAMVFSSNENAASYAEYIDAEEQIEYYATLEAKSVGQVSDIESIDNDIVTALGSYISSVSGNFNASNTDDYINKLNDKIATRQMLIGESVDFSSIVKELSDKMNSINIESCKPTSYITSDVSGIFSSYTDSLEDAFDYDNVLSLDSNTLENYLDLAENSSDSSSNNFGKLITDFTWYFCAEVQTEDIKDLSDGDAVEVTLKNSNEVLKCRVEKGADDVELAEEETVLILSCEVMNSSLAKLRLSDIDIRVEAYTGIMVPADAVHVNNGEKGVYVLVASIVTWRDVEIKYTGNNYVILSYSNETDNGIILYDEIIISGKDLSDGKVYT